MALRHFSFQNRSPEVNWPTADSLVKTMKKCIRGLAISCCSLQGTRLIGCVFGIDRAIARIRASVTWRAICPLTGSDPSLSSRIMSAQQYWPNGIELFHCVSHWALFCLSCPGSISFVLLWSVYLFLFGAPFVPVFQSFLFWPCAALCMFSQVCCLNWDGWEFSVLFFCLSFVSIRWHCCLICFLLKEKKQAGPTLIDSWSCGRDVSGRPLMPSGREADGHRKMGPKK